MTELDYVINKISDEIKSLEYSVARGSAKDFGEYQHLCGKIRGLLVAEEIVKALKERLENSDE